MINYDYDDDEETLFSPCNLPGTLCFSCISLFNYYEVSNVVLLFLFYKALSET